MGTYDGSKRRGENLPDIKDSQKDRARCEGRKDRARSNVMKKDT